MRHEIKRLAYFAAVIQFLTVSVYGMAGTPKLRFTQSTLARSNSPERIKERENTRSARTTNAVVTPPEIDSGVAVECLGRDDNQALAAAIASARGGWIVIAQGRTCAAGTMTIPNLHIETGGLLKVATGQTVTIAEKFHAGVYQTFANALPGQGTISFTPNTSLREIYPQWWGAKGDGSTDDTLALNSAFSQRGQNVFVPKGSYKITANLTPPVCAGITGAGRDQTIFAPAAGVSYGLKVSNATRILSHFVVDGSATTNATGIVFGDMKAADVWGGIAILIRTMNFKGPNGVGIRIADALKSELSGVLSDGNGTALLLQKISSGHPTTVTFRNCQFINSTTKGVRIIDGHSITFDGCVIESNREEGVFILPTSGGTVENINFVNGCWFEDNYASDANKYQFQAGDGTSIGGATIRPVLRDVFFAGSAGTAKAVNLSGPAVAGFILDNVQVPNLAGEIKIQSGAYGDIRSARNLEPFVISKP